MNSLYSLKVQCAILIQTFNLECYVWGVHSAHMLVSQMLLKCISESNVIEC